LSGGSAPLRVVPEIILRGAAAIFLTPPFPLDKKPLPPTVHPPGDNFWNSPKFLCAVTDSLTEPHNFVKTRGCAVSYSLVVNSLLELRSRKATV